MNRVWMAALVAVSGLLAQDKQPQPKSQKELEAIQAMFNAIAGLAIVLLRGVWERRAELALLQALGFRSGQLAWLVLAENAFLLVLGFPLDLGEGHPLVDLLGEPLLDELEGRLHIRAFGEGRGPDRRILLLCAHRMERAKGEEDEEQGPFHEAMSAEGDAGNLRRHARSRHGAMVPRVGRGVAGAVHRMHPSSGGTACPVGAVIPFRQAACDE